MRLARNCADGAEGYTRIAAENQKTVEGRSRSAGRDGLRWYLDYHEPPEIGCAELS
jgi:hypothetical protein